MLSLSSSLLLVAVHLLQLLPEAGATIVISSTLHPTVSGVYVRGVQHKHEKAYAKAATNDEVADNIPGEGMHLWLFYRDLGLEGVRWYIGTDIFKDSAMAFANSWSTDPCALVADNNNNININNNNSTPREGNLSWKVYRDNQWQNDPTFTIQCYGFDAGGIDACPSTSAAVPCVDLLGSGSNQPAIRMPVVMLGTAYISASHGAGAENPDVIEPPPAIDTAILELEYQGLDLGSQLHPAYANERAVGALLASSDTNNTIRDKHNHTNSRRQSVFLTTKLSPNEHGYESTLRAVQRSLRLLRTDTIDLFLIHHPQCLMTDHCEGDWVQSWKAMERMLGLGALRAIGVSNFDHFLLTHLLGDENNPGIARAPVSLVQNRADPLVPEDPNVLELCKTQNIKYQAFSVLGRQHVVGPWAAYWKAPHPILANPAIKAIANRLSAAAEEEQITTSNNKLPTTTVISPAQVVLRWAIQKGWTVVPKTAQVDRLESNRRVFHFRLTDSDMAVLDHLQAPPPPNAAEKAAAAAASNDAEQGQEL